MAVVQSAKTVLSAQAGTVTCAFPSNVTPGNLLVVSMAWWVSGGATAVTPIDTLGHTYVAALAERATQQDAALRTRTWYVANCSGGANTVTFDVTGAGSADITVVIGELSGCATVSPLDTTAAADVGVANTAPSSGNVTPTAYTSQVWGVLSYTGANTTIAQDAAWTQVQENEGGTADAPIAVAYRTLTSGADDASWTLGAARGWVTQAFSFKPAPSTAPTVTWGTVNTGTTGASLNVNEPASIAIGDLLLIAASSDTATLPTTPTGYIALPGGNISTGTGRLDIFARIATAANETVTYGGVAQDIVLIMGKISAAQHGVTNILEDIRWGTIATGSGNANPPSVSSRGVALDWLAIALACIDQTTAANTLTAQPSGYTTVTLTESASSTSSVFLGVATKALTAATTEDPGTFTNTSANWICQTLLIPPPVTADTVGSNVVSTDFTGTNGAAWPSPWVSTDLSSGTTATINTNRGRVVTGAVGGYADHGFLTETAGVTDSDVICDFVCQQTTECYQRLVARADASILAAYSAEVEWDSGVYVSLNESDSAGTVTHAFQVGPAYGRTIVSGTTVVHVRLRVEGSVYKCKFWFDSEAEPTTWWASVTDTTLTTGRTGVQNVGSGTAAAKTLDYDNYVRRSLTAVAATSLAPRRHSQQHLLIR